MHAVWPALRSAHGVAPANGRAISSATGTRAQPACRSVRQRASGDEMKPAMPPATRPLLSGRRRPSGSLMALKMLKRAELRTTL